MTLDEFGERCISASQEHFAEAGLDTRTKHGTVFEARVQVDDETCAALYFNTLTGKTSLMLICGGERTAGCHNYRSWHYHPFGRSQEHVTCQELILEDVFTELEKAIAATGTQSASQDEG
jgi:hypothetical protein